MIFYLIFIAFAIKMVVKYTKKYNAEQMWELESEQVCADGLHSVGKLTKDFLLEQEKRKFADGTDKSKFEQMDFTRAQILRWTSDTGGEKTKRNRDVLTRTCRTSS